MVLTLVIILAARGVKPRGGALRKRTWQFRPFGGQVIRPECSALVNSVAALHGHTSRDSTRPKKKQHSDQIAKKTKLSFFLL
jgi:hypothetical protein